MNKSRRTQKKASLKDFILELILAFIGIISASIGLKVFLLPNLFLDGGVTGVSLLINRVSGLNISILLILINLPFLILGFKHISSRLAIRSFFSIIGLALAVHYIEVPALTDDRVLIAFFGGLFLGAGIGFSLRGGIVIDGTEILAIYLSKKFKTTIGTIILIFNVILFLIAGLIFNVEIALYSILTYVSASKTTDYIIHGIEEYIGVTIISQKSQDIRAAITQNLGYGVTIYKGKGGHQNEEASYYEYDIIHTIVTRLELYRLHKEVDKIDGNAFIIEYNINDTRGGMIKKRVFK